MIMNKNTNGFLPNKQNKYSIRKYTVGTASLLIGATLVFGAHAEDAKAAEEQQLIAIKRLMHNQKPLKPQ